MKKKLKNFFTLTRKAEGGFTLVELIVVIAILGILGGVAVPAYSGYVKKAERAADEQLLAYVNQAFAAACIENGTDAILLDSAYATLSDDGTVAAVYRTQAGDSYNVAFDKYYDMDENGAFKVFKMLTFKEGMFVEGNAILAALRNIFSSTDIDTFNSSVFAELGLDELMGKVDLATLTAMEADDGSTLNLLVMDSSNYDSLAKYLGFDDSSSEGFEEALWGLIKTKATEMAPAGTSEEDMYYYYELAEKQILANNAVLVAATNSTFDTATFAQQLAAGNGKNTIKTSMNTDDGEQVALSQTAMAYAMYTSYMERSGGTASNNINDVLDVLESDGFKNYMNNADGGEDEADADMQGYLAAMNMINSASGNNDAVSLLLTNGFTDPDLLALLNQEIN